ncbi:MAG TPA: hypothetical protein VGF48_16580 [Thermoanaerobaculia bacterium]|jgi:hypothetical protein
MSLRAFHVIFIVVSVVLSLYIAIWGVREFAQTRSMSGLGLAIVFVAAAAVLIIYGKKTFRKLRELP